MARVAARTTQIEANCANEASPVVPGVGAVVLDLPVGEKVLTGPFDGVLERGAMAEPLVAGVEPPEAGATTGATTGAPLEVSTGATTGATLEVSTGALAGAIEEESTGATTAGATVDAKSEVMSTGC